ncbi:hypothetical protein [Spirillospora sp. NPDC047279]|uniref:hypothetical protein n=1 Tax=Spirillospora sp. NPDC047279 TaxID=3155478 RepID=UPI0033C8363F
MIYEYVGPADVAARTGPAGRRIASPGDFAAWAAESDLSEPFTYVVALDGTLRLAPRRSEHVACAAGAPVLAAGEITFAGGAVTEVSNQSTGYCPDLTSWPDVAAALDRAGLARPGGFTYPIVFRRCPSCGEITIVKDGHYACPFCDAGLPAEWNVTRGR